MKKLKTKLTLSCATLLILGGSGAYVYKTNHEHQNDSTKSTVVQLNKKSIAEVIKGAHVLVYSEKGQLAVQIADSESDSQKSADVPTEAEAATQNDAFNQLKAFVNDKLKISNDQLIVTNESAIKDYVAEHFSELSAGNDQLTQDDIVVSILDGIDNINDAAEDPGVTLNPDGSVPGTPMTDSTISGASSGTGTAATAISYKTNRTHGNFQMMVSYSKPSHTNNWWGVRYYSTTKNAAYNMAGYFSRQSNNFWALTGAAAAWASMGLSAAAGGLTAGGAAVCAAEMGNISSDVSYYINRGTYSIDADVNNVPYVWNVHKR
jgi:hypothetical protein